MITLSQRLKRKSQSDEGTTSRASIRDRLLVKEAQEMSQLLPTCCSVHYNNENDLSKFTLTVRPTEGYWESGTFIFEITVTEEYNMVVNMQMFIFSIKNFQKNFFSLLLLNVLQNCGIQTLQNLVKYAYHYFEGTV